MVEIIELTHLQVFSLATHSSMSESHPFVRVTRGVLPSSPLVFYCLMHRMCVRVELSMLPVRLFRLMQVTPKMILDSLLFVSLYFYLL